MPKRTASSTRTRRARQTGFVPVQIINAPVVGLIVTTPGGIRIEGLSLEQVIAFVFAVER